MKRKQKFAMIISIGYTVLWFVLFILSIVARITYRASEGADRIEVLLLEIVYNVFILVALMGLISSVLFLLPLIWGRKVSKSKLRNLYRIKNSALIFAGIENLLFYLSVLLLFWIKTAGTLVAFLIGCMWCICFIVYVILLIVLKWKTRKMGASLEQ